MSDTDSATLIGLAVADALGMPFETRLPTDPFLKAWDGHTYHPSGYHRLAPGQWTDDTMMSKLLAESLVSVGAYDPADVADRYRRWYLGGDHRGMGKTTKVALAALNNGSSWSGSGVEGAEGNGTAMRIAPLGLFYRNDLNLVCELALYDSRITHKSKEAGAGSKAIAIAIALLATGCKKRELVKIVPSYLPECEVKRGIQKVEFYQEAGGIGIAEALSLLGTKAHVVDTVPSAIAAFVLTNSYQEAIESAIRAGGDTDTTAAVAGALAGTYYGLKGIPTEYLSKLEAASTLLSLDKKLKERRAPVRIAV